MKERRIRRRYNHSGSIFDSFLNECGIREEVEAVATKRVKASEIFEEKIKRICDLLADSGAEVKWNDHISDPDNPAQGRQIDVTIKQAGVLTLVECRQRKSRQDVQWIEQLIGRRVSLSAQAVIAVSSSGFTAGAIAKARKHGIILRDLQELTDGEIASWGQRVGLTLFLYEYSDLGVFLLFDQESLSKITPEAAQSELRDHLCVQSLFNAAAKKLAELNLMAEEEPRWVSFGLKIQFDVFLLCGVPVLEVEFTGKARLISQKITPSVVYGYGEPNEDNGDREAMIQDFSYLGNSSISHSGNRISTWRTLVYLAARARLNLPLPNSRNSISSIVWSTQHALAGIGVIADIKPLSERFILYV